MLGIIAVLSDIPAYIAEIISKVTGNDMSAVLDVFNFGIRDIIEAIEQIFTIIG